MIYKGIEKAVFLRRPNRFIAVVERDGREETVHVKNTGRCRELLVPGAEVYLQYASNPARKTVYDLIAVKKGERLINMDAMAPNAVFGEFLRGGGLGFVPWRVKSECVHGDSRFDFYFEHGDVRAFCEVKGVTLEENGIVRFPDAPTERGVKHLQGLIRCVEEGYEAWAVFVVQMGNVRYLEPNAATHPAFAEAMARAGSRGVKLRAYSCAVTPESLAITGEVPVHIPGWGL